MTTGANPWGLSHRQQEIAEAMSVLGDTKLVARQCGVEPKTVNQSLIKTRELMGVRNDVCLAVKYDRWAQELLRQCKDSGQMDSRQVVDTFGMPV